MEALTCGNTEIAPQDLRISMNKLARTQKSSKQTGYEREFKVPKVFEFSIFTYILLVFLCHLLVFFSQRQTIMLNICFVSSASATCQ